MGIKPKPWQPTPFPTECPDCKAALRLCSQTFSQLMAYEGGQQRDGNLHHRVALCSSCGAMWRKEWRYSTREEWFDRGTKWDRDDFDMCERLDEKRRAKRTTDAPPRVTDTTKVSKPE